jgi:serine/threonine-protein kinase RsbW
VPTVLLRFSPLPANVRTARLVVATVGRRSGVDESLLDEIKLAIGEACARAVGVHEAHRPTEPVEVSIRDDADRFTVEVRDRGPGGAEAAEIGDVDDLLDEDLPPGLDLAVIAGLVDDVEISEASPGTVVRMSWPLAAPVPS